jgi:ATP-dependent DNA helicase RecG
MDLLTGPAEQRIIKNVAAMIFCDHPDKFFPYTQISVVIFPEGKIQNPNRFTEKTFKGSVPTMIQEVMSYLQSIAIQEYVIKPKDRMESIRYFNYPYQALEEAVVNAMYHRDYQEYQEVEITIEPNRISILSFSGPDRSIPAEAIKSAKAFVHIVVVTINLAIS